MVTSTAFAIPTNSTDFWQKRLNDYGIATRETVRFGERVIQFEDPHGLALMKKYTSHIFRLIGQLQTELDKCLILLCERSC
jgi:hypothetical protein